MFLEQGEVKQYSYDVDDAFFSQNSKSVEEQTIDDLLALAFPSQRDGEQSDTLSVNVTVYQIKQFDANPMQATLHFEKSKLPDYTELFSITSQYWGDIRESMDKMAMMPCLCADHGSVSRSFSTSFQESSFSSNGSYFFEKSSEEHHDHCPDCGECLKDGKCPKCGHAH